jgi:glycosyltransferase involved in cell wall biosynthesis
MKILQVFDVFSPYESGTGVLLYQLSKALAERGHKVTIICGDWKIDRSYNNSLKGVEVLPFRIRYKPLGFPIMPSMVGWVRDNLKQFDIIHQHSYRNFANIVIQHYANKYHIPYILDMHGSFPRIGKQSLKMIFDICIGNSVVKDSCKVVAETNVNIKDYLNGNIPLGKIVLLPPPPCDVELFNKLPEAGLFRKKYGLDKKQLVIFLGRIHWVKGLDFLVETFSELARDRDDVMLVIVGNDDGYKTTLDTMIDKYNLSDKVLFTGYLGGNDKLSALRDADVFVQPSRFESGVGAPIEAVLCGTPIIVTKHTGSGEDVASMNVGYLFEFGNKDDLKTKIQFVLNNSSETKAKTLQAQGYIRSHLSMTQKVKEYESLYEVCLEYSRRTRP